MRGARHTAALQCRRRQDPILERSCRKIRVVITRTPYRISFFGGGTDYPSWFTEHGGGVLATTIDKYCYIAARRLPPFFDYRYRVSWSKIETVKERGEIKHRGVLGCLSHLDDHEPLEATHTGDLPARSGLGSSSAFTVGMLHALHALRHEYVTKHELARQAITVEQVVLKETVGVQDQIQCAHGGLNYIEIRRDGTFTVRPLISSDSRLAELEAHLMMFYTGTQRFSSDVAKAQVSNIDRKTDELRAIMNLTHRAIAALAHGPLSEFGRLLHESWMLKRSLSPKVSTPAIDEIYQRAIETGAMGGKVLGAGSGGFVIFFVRPAIHGAMRKALGLLEVPVRFESAGTSLVVAS